jgi:hypothetical protein
MTIGVWARSGYDVDHAAFRDLVLFVWCAGGRRIFGGIRGIAIQDCLSIGATSVVRRSLFG